MLWNASSLNGYAIEASDGRLGTVSDFFFDDVSWKVRWLVVDTGTWLSGRKVLLPVSVLGHIDEKREQFAVRLTKQEIKNSPDIDADMPVSRQMESSIYEYYGWDPYWGDGFSAGFSYLGGGMAAPLTPEARKRQEQFAYHRTDGDPHLRSMAAVSGYHIHAVDGEIGHVEDFFVQDGDWSIHYLLVDTKNWWPGKKVLISPKSVQTIDWSNRLVNISVTRQHVKDSPAYDAATLVDRDYQRRYHSYYGGLRPTHPPEQVK